VQTTNRFYGQVQERDLRRREGVVTGDLSSRGLDGNVAGGDPSANILANLGPEMAIQRLFLYRRFHEDHIEPAGRAASQGLLLAVVPVAIAQVHMLAQAPTMSSRPLPCYQHPERKNIKETRSPPWLRLTGMKQDPTRAIGVQSGRLGTSNHPGLSDPLKAATNARGSTTRRPPSVPSAPDSPPILPTRPSTPVWPPANGRPRTTIGKSSVSSTASSFSSSRKTATCC